MNCPNCKSSIPDDANFCPLCGELVTKEPTLAQFKLRILKKEHDKLCKQRKCLLSLEQERQKLYMFLTKSADYATARKEYIDLTSQNDYMSRERQRYDDKMAIVIPILCLTGFAIGAYLGYNDNKGEIFNIVDVIKKAEGFELIKNIFYFLLSVGYILVIAGLCTLLPTVIVAIIYFIKMSNYVQTPVDIPYINENIKTFMEKHKDSYDLIYCGLDDEISNPEKITKTIIEKVENIESNIKVVEHEIELIQN